MIEGKIKTVKLADVIIIFGDVDDMQKWLYI